MIATADGDAVVLLFTDLEGSTRLWESEPARMRGAMACHDRLLRGAIESHGGTLVKTTGDGVYAAFADPRAGVSAAVAVQRALADPAATAGVELRARVGVHMGAVDRRDHDYFGTAVNRAARIMGAAHGGQVLVSHAVAEAVAGCLPDAVALRELGTVRLRDLARPERLWQLVHPDLRGEFPPLRSLESTPNNLPLQLNSFVGRERAVTEVRAALASSRLVSLVGTGGLGKTRLSVQLGADLLDEFPDGVWLVELAPIADPRLVPQAVADVLAVKEEGGSGAVGALVRFVHDRRLLVVLDNCEHLLRAAAELVQTLLRAGPDVRVLATSREPLHVAGETICALSTLPVATADAITRSGIHADQGAVRLFAERAAAVRPGFVVDTSNVTFVTDICRHLDGIPLAIELAAARVRSLPVDAIASRLSDRFRLLTGGGATALPRQQTLRACLEWSHDLLTGSERVLLRRTAAFAGDFSLDAAESVAAGDGVAPPDVASLVAQLVDRSLVEFDAATGRYRLLETVREFAHERLRDAAEIAEAEAHYVDYYARLAHATVDRLVGPDRESALRQLDLERENLLAAGAACDRVPAGGERGLTIVLAILNLCSLRGQLELADGIAEVALARSGAGADTMLRCRVLLQASQLCYMAGQYARARARAEEGLAVARAANHPGRTVTALRLLGLLAVVDGNRAAALDHLCEALERARALDNRYLVASTATSLADLHRAEGRFDAAKALYLEVLNFARERRDDATTATIHINLALTLLGRGDFAAARDMLREALAVATAPGNTNLTHTVLEVVAAVAAGHDRGEIALQLHGAGAALREAQGFHLEPADDAVLAPLVARARAAMGAAANAAESRGRALPAEGAIALARQWLASA